jgi:cytochrome o ubiquinol oxidase subunit IV
MTQIEAKHDHAPGDEPPEDNGHWVRNANIGLGFSIVLTVGAFLLAGSHAIYTPAVPVALLVWIMDHLSRDMMPM